MQALSTFQCVFGSTSDKLGYKLHPDRVQHQKNKIKQINWFSSGPFLLGVVCTNQLTRLSESTVIFTYIDQIKISTSKCITIHKLHA